jgi:hypothetical protein
MNKMDTYHFVLTKLYEASGGKDSKPVNFRDLLKQIGYYGSYADILERLSREGWIAEDEKRPHHVRITHWGISEAKKSLSSATESDPTKWDKLVNQSKVVAKEILALLDSVEKSEESMRQLDNKISELSNLIAQLKPEIK